MSKNNKILCRLVCEDGFSFETKLEQNEIDIIESTISSKGLEVEINIPGAKNNFPGNIEVPRKKIKSIQVFNEKV